MIAWVAWISVFLGTVLLAVLGVLLYRLMAAGEKRRVEEPANRRYVPTTTDETMVISREQADEMLNK